MSGSLLGETRVRCAAGKVLTRSPPLHQNLRPLEPTPYCNFNSTQVEATSESFASEHFRILGVPCVPFQRADLKVAAMFSQSNLGALIYLSFSTCILTCRFFLDGGTAGPGLVEASKKRMAEGHKAVPIQGGIFQHCSPWSCPRFLCGSMGEDFCIRGSVTVSK